MYLNFKNIFSGILCRTSSSQRGPFDAHERPLDLLHAPHRQEVFPGQGQAERVPLRVQREAHDPPGAGREGRQGSNVMKLLFRRH
jgi:hypothetical protein